jgi:serine/threonine protein kinase
MMCDSKGLTTCFAQDEAPAAKAVPATAAPVARPQRPASQVIARRGSVARRGSLARSLTHSFFAPGKDLNHIVEDVNNHERPNMLRLRSKLHGSVIDPKLLVPTKVLGEGAFGIVYKCAYNPPPSTDPDVDQLIEEAGGFVALKKLKTVLPVAEEEGMSGGGVPVASAAELARQRDADLALFAHEMLLMQSLRHPHVIGYIGCTLSTDENGDDQLAIAQEFAPHGTLKPLLETMGARGKPFTTADGLRWAHHIALGMSYLHACNPPIIHRDLKPENILLCGDRAVAKLADFGLVTFEKRGVRKANYKMTGKVGSLRYMSPENYRGEDYTYKTDIYSFSIIMFELLARASAFDGSFLSSEMIAENAGNNQLRPTVPPQWPDEAKSLCARCWSNKLDERPEFQAISRELADWRLDDSHRVLKGIAAGSKHTMIEKLLGKSMLATTYADRYSKRMSNASKRASIAGTAKPK